MAKVKPLISGCYYNSNDMARSIPREENDPLSNSPINSKSRAVPWLLSALALAMILIQAPDKPLVLTLRFERETILAGEYWRLFSGHVVHLGWAHLLLNLAGLVLVYVLGGNRLSPAAWGLTGLLGALVIDAGLWLWKPEIQWYAGLSGVLHGWFVVSVIALGREHGWRVGGPLLALVATKLAWEMWRGPVPGTAELIGASVVVEVHLFGALAGVASAATMEISRRLTRRVSQA
jgi:rhomboid family GlyGly-CTERM serine protease